MTYFIKVAIENEQLQFVQIFLTENFGNIGAVVTKENTFVSVLFIEENFIGVNVTMTSLLTSLILRVAFIALQCELCQKVINNKNVT